MSLPHPDAPRDPRAGRFEGLRSVLRVERLLAGVLAALAIIVPSGAIADVLGLGVFVLLVASAPLRVGWLAQRWLRRGDLLFGVLAALLFCLPAVGWALSAFV